jgi:hypothetical protein
VDAVKWKMSCPCWESTPRRPARSLTVIPTNLSYIGKIYPRA